MNDPTLYQIGPLAIRHLPFNADTVDRDREAAIAIKPVLGTRQPGEIVGEAEEKITLSGTQFPYRLGGEREIELARGLADGDPVFIMRGDGVPLGWHQITRFSSREAHLGPDGTGSVVRVTIEARRCPAPSRSLLAMLLQLVMLFL